MFKLLKRHSHNRGYTLIEMLVVISIMAIIMAVVLVSVSKARSKARDAERVNTMHLIVLALERYYEKHHYYPTSDNAGPGGWDNPANGTFIQDLKNEGFFPNDIKDPQNLGDNYRYYMYTASSYGCAAASYYVLGIMDLENQTNPAKGSPGWACSGRDWQNEFEWVTGHYR